MEILPEQLGCFAPFNMLDEGSLALLQGIVSFKNYTKGEIIIYEDECRRSLPFLICGEIKAYKVGRFENEIFLGFLQRGILLELPKIIYNDAFFSTQGEYKTAHNCKKICDVTGCPKAASCDILDAHFKAFYNIECLQDCIIACFDGRKLLELFQTNLQILSLFFREMARKLAKHQEVIKKELIFDSTAKVAYALFTDLSDFNARKKQDNAALLNIQPETLSRILKRLTRDGIISTNSLGKIQIDNRIALENTFKQDLK